MRKYLKDILNIFVVIMLLKFCYCVIYEGRIICFVLRPIFWLPYITYYCIPLQNVRVGLYNLKITGLRFESGK